MFETNFSWNKKIWGGKKEIWRDSDAPPWLRAWSLVCVVIKNSSYPTVKNNSTAYHAFGKHWIQARGL